jgi:putative ABC transport system permease protein
MAEIREVGARLVWRAWRRWLPQWYRERYEAELIRDHIERSGSRSSAAFWLALLWDCMTTGVAARMDVRRHVMAPPLPARTTMQVLMLLRRLSMIARRLARQPAFSAGIILTLALAIGANLTMFSILDRLLLRAPTGVEDASQVKRLYVHGPTLFDPGIVYSSHLSYPDYSALTQVDGFAAVAAYHAEKMTVGRGASVEQVTTATVTASYFELLGVTAAIGRLLHADDDVTDVQQPAVVLSHAYWQRRLGGDASILGRELDIGRGRYTVIGVTERGFSGVDLEAVDLWLPLHAAGVTQSGRGWLNAPGWIWLQALVRLHGDTDAAASAAAAEATARIVVARESLPARLQSSRVVPASLIAARGPNPMNEASIARLLLALAGLVLLIGGANVINLLLARGAQRRREHAVQRALGAGRAHIATDLLLEAAMLAIAAGVLAFVIAKVVAPAVFQLLMPEASPDVLAVDRTLTVAALLVATLVLLIGVVPAYRASVIDPMAAMRAQGGGASAGWLRRSLLFVQAAVSIVLLIGAGLFVRSLQRAAAVDLGIATETLTVAIELQDGVRFGERLAPPIYAAYERLRTHPTVVSASVTSIPPWGGGWGLEVATPELGKIDAGVNGPFFVSAGPDYFRTLGFPVLAGRALTADDDRPGAEPVVVVNEAMAHFAWPHESVLGKCLLIGRTTDACSRVVGVVGNYRAELASDNSTPLYYIAPHHPGIGFTGATSLLVRVHGDPIAAVPTITQLIHAASPEIRFATVAPLYARLEPQLRAWRLGARVLTAFSVLALIVAAAGLYSVLTFEVTQRRFELAVRAALGASGMDLVRAMAARTLLFTSAGIVAGIGAAALLGRVVESLLFEVRTTDPGIHAYAVVTLCTAAAVAFLVPIRRARAADPMQALREE